MYKCISIFWDKIKKLWVLCIPLYVNTAVHPLRFSGILGMLFIFTVVKWRERWLGKSKSGSSLSGEWNGNGDGRRGAIRGEYYPREAGTTEDRGHRWEESPHRTDSQGNQKVSTELFYARVSVDLVFHDWSSFSWVLFRASANGCIYYVANWWFNTCLWIDAKWRVGLRCLRLF